MNKRVQDQRREPDDPAGTTRPQAPPAGAEGHGDPPVFRDLDRRGGACGAGEEAVRGDQAHGPALAADREGLEPEGLPGVPAGKLPYEVPKSSCVFCPYRTNQSWRHLKETDPAGWDRAVQIDAALRDKNSVATRGFRQELFVHRSCVPLPVIDFDALAPNTLDPMFGECQGMCGL